MAERGRCGGCGRTYSVTPSGRVIRAHDRDGLCRSTWARPERACPGGGMPPIGPDEPLVTTELATLRHENAQLRLELDVAQKRLKAATALALAGDKWRELARIAMQGMFAEQDAMFARWEADDAHRTAMVDGALRRLNEALAR